jgi:hypothetical protein
MRRDELLAKMQADTTNVLTWLITPYASRWASKDENSGRNEALHMDRTHAPPADSSREFGDTAAIHLVVPNVSRVDVPMTRTERNAVAFDYFCKKFKDDINV